ncbi:MAG: hypothetical protein AAF378_15735 [Cyanobacteria bacterium P01_A01_bin.84]
MELARIKSVKSSVNKLLLATLLALLWNAPVQAQRDLLTRAEVYKILNQVQLLLRNKPARRAKLRDVLVPLDALTTKARSRAELLFNEGSLARIGPNGNFRFKPGTRRLQLPGRGLRSETILEMKKGVAVVMVPPGGSTTKVETTQGTADIFSSQISGKPTPEPNQLPSDITENFKGSALAIITDDSKKTTRFLNLTRHPVAINNPQGTQTVILRGGQTVTVNDGTIGEVQNFDLKKFYQTTKLATGLGPGQEDLITKEPEPVQKTLRLLRKETLLTIETQALWVNGLCSLNSRGGASTLSTNCITTGNDPIDKFEGVREVLPPRDINDDRNDVGGNDVGGNDLPNPNNGNDVGGNDLPNPNNGNDVGGNDLPNPDNGNDIGGNDLPNPNNRNDRDINDLPNPQ